MQLPTPWWTTLECSGIDSNVMTLWLPQVPGYPECHGLSCHTSELPYVFNNLEIISKSYAMATEAKNVSLVRSK